LGSNNSPLDGTSVNRDTLQGNEFIRAKETASTQPIIGDEVLKENLFISTHPSSDLMVMEQNMNLYNDQNNVIDRSNMGAPDIFCFLGPINHIKETHETIYPEEIIPSLPQLNRLVNLVLLMIL
jgi:hypothetical protein